MNLWILKLSGQFFDSPGEIERLISMTTPFTTWFSCRMTAGIQRKVNRGLQGAIVMTLLAGVRRRDPSVVINGIVSVAFAAMPRYFENRYDIRFRPWQRVWVSTAALVHTLGMLGPYDRIWWWDHLAHTLSGVVVAGAADVVFQVETEDISQSPVLPRSRSAFIGGITLGFGIGWEILEYAIHSVANQLGFDPLLVHYGRLDAIGDVLFDLLGAGLVISFGQRTLSNVVKSVTDE